MHEDFRSSHYEARMIAIIGSTMIASTMAGMVGSVWAGVSLIMGVMFLFGGLIAMKVISHGQ